MKPISFLINKSMFFFTFLLFTKQYCNGQFTGSEKFTNFMTWDSTTIELSEAIYKDILCPSIFVTEPTVIVLLGVIEIDTNGNLIRVFQLNNADYRTFIQFETIVHREKPQWKNHPKDTAYIILPIEFRNIPDENYSVDYSKKTYFINDPIICLFKITPIGFENDKYHIEKYESYLKKKKYKAALQEIDLLINRQPFKELFYLKKIRLLTYNGDIKQAEIESKKVQILFENE